ncbi:MAG: hypothetical protein ABSA90_13350 [Xanthobacteraceae bacterium]|jgi:hypothetical protein
MSRALSGFLEALEAAGPAPDRASNMNLYGWLIGSWKLDVTGFLDDGRTRRRPGEWHFGWILEGRAIQDVWIVPPRGSARAGDAEKNVNSYGTTLRTYVSKLDAWHIQWTDPVTQTFFNMIGRKDDDNIIQFGQGTGNNLIRWSFREITPNSFLRRGEVSADQGATWRTNVEFRAQRIENS